MKDFRKYLVPVFLFGLALFYYSMLENYTLFSLYQARDFQRTFNLLNGEWVWYGPDLSGGGHTPGPFYYLVLAIPLSLFGTWQSVFWFEIILAAGAIMVFWFFLKNRFDSTTALIFYFLYLTSAIFEKNLTQFWNPSFLPFFQALLICLFFNYRSLSIKSLALGGIILGLTFQIHYQQLLIFAGLLLTLLLDRTKSVKSRIGSALVLMISSFGPCIPYFVSESTRGGASDTFSGGLQSLFVTFSKLQESNRLENGIEKFFGDYLSKEPAFIFLLIIWFAIGISNIFKKKKFEGGNIFLVSTLAVSSLLVLPILYKTAYLRYAIPFFICFYMVSASRISRLFRENPQRSIAGLCLLSFLILIIHPLTRTPHSVFEVLNFSSLYLMGLAGVLSYLVFAPKERRLSFLLLVPLLYTNQIKVVEDTHNVLLDRERFVEFLVQKTGWTWEYFRERAFIVSNEHEEDFSIFYRKAFEESPSPLKARNFDGVLVNYNFRRLENHFFGFTDALQMDWEGVKDQLPEEVQSMAIRGEIACVENYRLQHQEICFYEFVDPEINFTWNNLGHPYEYLQPWRSTIAKIKGNQGSLKTDKLTWEFYINACSDRDPSCSVYFIFRRDGEEADVLVMGDPISTPEAIINPIWALSLEQVYLDVNCGGKVSKHKVVSRLGFNSYVDSYSRPIFHGPFRNRISFECANPLELTLYAEEAYSLPKSKKIPDGRFHIKWHE